MVQNGHCKSSYATSTTLDCLAPRTGRPLTSIFLITSPKGSAESSIRLTLTMDFWSLARRNGKSCFRSPSPIVTGNASKPGHSGLAFQRPITTGTSAGNLYVARNWRSILAAISICLDCEAQFTPLTDKKTTDKRRSDGRISNREESFTLDPLMLDLSANYLMPSLCLSMDQPRRQGDIFHYGPGCVHCFLPPHLVRMS